MHFGMIDRDAVGDRLEQHRLAGLGRTDDQAALSAAHRRDEVDHASGEFGRVIRFQLKPLVWEDGGEVLEVRAGGGLGGAEPVDEVDPGESVVLLALLGRADGADHVVAGAQSAAP